MATTSELDRVSMVVLRYVRNPVFVLILVYAIGITGMALIPGEDADGNVEYMSLFHAFYFFTYTATTTGFGEIPNTFTDVQRLWTIVCLYMGVVAWLYAISSIIRLAQNPHFVMALSEHRFARTVNRIKQPFVIICGFGDTGSLLARRLSDHWIGAVVIDTDPERIKALALRDYQIKMPALCADPGIPKHLIDAGVRHPQCKAVVVLTSDEAVNLDISVMARFLNPALPILCRSTKPRYKQQLLSLEHMTVINPFELFAQLLSLAIVAPRLHNLNACLVHSQGVKLGRSLDVPVGDWILCGYGRMGKWLHKYLVRHGIHPVIIDPEAEDIPDAARLVRGPANRITLEQAGIQHAAGIVAGTDSDHGNLNILMSVRALRPNAFTILRQNSHVNQVAFDAAEVELVLQSSMTTARRILKHLISPHIQIVIDYLREQGEDLTVQVVEQLKSKIGERRTHLWRVNLCTEEARSVLEHMRKNRKLTLAELLRNPHQLEESLACMSFMIDRDGDFMMLPAGDTELCEGDEILLCGTRYAETLLRATMNNPYTLNYLVSCEDAPRGYVFQWLARRRQSKTVE